MKKVLFLSLTSILILLTISPVFSGGKWYNHYEEGLDFMKNGQYARAIEKFVLAAQVKGTDSKRIKTYGMHFIEYFPHREMGICFFNLGQLDRAKRQLGISLKQEYSARAQEYMAKIAGGTSSGIQNEPPTPVQPDLTKKVVQPVTPPPSEPVISGGSPLKLVGERMGIAVLPFETKGLGTEIQEINIVEQMMTTFYNLNRFKLFERTQLEKILEEQKLGMSGVLDASTAAEIGKGIGVDAIVLGSVTRAGGNVAIDARLIDTESAEIITAQDEMCTRTNIQEIKNMIQRLASKIGQDLPLVEGYVINVSSDQLTLDIGSQKGIKKGMKCIIYREGQDIIHPITKKVLGKQTEELGEIKLEQVYPAYSVGRVVRSDLGSFEIGNKVITK